MPEQLHGGGGGAIVVSGYLQKKKNEDKRSLVGSKYNRRWFELTTHTLGYAKEPRDFRGGGGKLEVFSVQDIKWVKQDKDNKDNKFQVKFVERLLTLKAQDQAEVDKWVTGIAAAQKQGLDLKATNALLGSDEWSRQQGAIAAGQHGADDGEDGQEDVTHVTSFTALRSPTSSAGGLGGAAAHDVQSGPRSPSPRSLLANPKAITAFVAAAKEGKYSDGGSQQQKQQQLQPASAARGNSADQNDDSGTEEDESPAIAKLHHGKSSTSARAASPAEPVASKPGSSTAVRPASALKKPAGEVLMLSPAAATDHTPSRSRTRSAGSNASTCSVRPVSATAVDNQVIVIGDDSGSEDADEVGPIHKGAASSGAAAAAATASWFNHRDSQKLLLKKARQNGKLSGDGAPAGAAAAAGGQKTSLTVASQQWWDDSDSDCNIDGTPTKVGGGGGSATAAGTLGRNTAAAEGEGEPSLGGWVQQGPKGKSEPRDEEHEHVRSPGVQADPNWLGENWDSD